MLVRLDIMPVDTDLNTGFPGMRSTRQVRSIGSTVLLHEGERVVFPSQRFLHRAIGIIDHYVHVRAEQQVDLFRQRNKGSEIREEGYLRTDTQAAFRLRSVLIVLHAELMNVRQRQVPFGIVARVGDLTFHHFVFLRNGERRGDTYRRENAGFPMLLAHLELQRDRNTEVMNSLSLAPGMYLRRVVVVGLQIRVRLT